MLGCVVMAAGRGVRFGGEKLLAELRGKPLLYYTLAALPPHWNTVAVASSPAVLAYLARAGVRSVRNPAPEKGVGGTIRLGTEALQHCEAIL